MINFNANPKPVPYVHLMGVGVGVGKSHEAREQVKSIAPLLPEKSCLVIATPTHALNDEHADRLRERLVNDGVKVAVYRGRGAKDPARPGQLMCDHADEAAELSSVGGNAKHLCSRRKKGGTVRCISYDECGYRRQNSLSPLTWIVPHAVLTRKPPACISNVSAVIVDEDPLQTFLGGFGRPVRVSLDEISAFRFTKKLNVVGDPVINISETVDLEAAAKGLRKVLISLTGTETAIPVGDLSNAGLTSELMFGIQRTILDGKIKVEVSPDMSPTARQERIKEADVHNRPILRLARLYKLIGNAISAGQEVVLGCRFERGVQSSDGAQYDAVRLRWLEPLHADWHSPTIILSATAKAELLTPIWPQLQLVADVNPMAPHATVRQIVWSAAKSKLQNENHLHRLKRYIEARAFEYRNQGAEIEGRRVDVLVITQLNAEADLTNLRLPGNVDTAHFNAVEGIDKWGSVACLISIGRTMASPDDVGLMAEVLSGNVVERDDSFEGGWYPREVVGIRMKGSGDEGYPTFSETHPDGIAEAVRWSIAEAGLVQAIGRGRAVNRKEADPLQIDIISTMPLPMTVNEVLGKDAIEPDPFIVMAARGLVVAETATKGKWQIIAKVLPDLYPTEDAARMALNRTNANKNILLANVRLSDFTSASIKLEGSRYAVPVKIDSSQGDPKEIAENLLGPLATFKLLPVEMPEPSIPALVYYLEPPFTTAKPNRPPLHPEQPYLVSETLQSAQAPLPEPGAYEPPPVKEDSRSYSASYNSIVEELTGGGIPEADDWVNAARIWLAGKNVSSENAISAAAWG